jgi:ribonucleoside-diphosphate reductase alpha chain
MTPDIASSSLQAGPQRETLPNRRGSESFQFQHQAITYTATISRYSDGRLGEIFLDHSRPNSQLAELANDAAVLASLLLQHGITAASIRHSISGPLATALALVGAEP